MSLQAPEGFGKNAGRWPRFASSRASSSALAGGVFRTRDAAFYERLERGIRAAAADARLVRLAAPPVLGAALIALDRRSPAGAVAPEVDARLRAALEGWDPR